MIPESQEIMLQTSCMSSSYDLLWYSLLILKSITGRCSSHERKNSLISCQLVIGLWGICLLAMAIACEKQLQIISTITYGIGYDLTVIALFQKTHSMVHSLFPMICILLLLTITLSDIPTIMYTLASFQIMLRWHLIQISYFFSTFVQLFHQCSCRMTTVELWECHKFIQRSHSFISQWAVTARYEVIILEVHLQCARYGLGILTKIWDVLNITNDYTNL